MLDIAGRLVLQSSTAMFSVSATFGRETSVSLTQSLSKVSRGSWMDGLQFCMSVAAGGNRQDVDVGHVYLRNLR